MYNFSFLQFLLVADSYRFDKYFYIDFIRWKSVLHNFKIVFTIMLCH